MKSKTDITSLSPSDTIFATGAFLQPVEVVINGVKQWRWIVVGFEDDSYHNGSLIDVIPYADSLEQLTQSEE